MMITCKNCGKDFPAGTQMDEQSFETAVLTNKSEQCPNCAQVLSYDKQDYFFR